MFHTFAIYSNGETLNSINKSIASSGLRKFLIDIEYNNKKLIINNFCKTTITNGLFLLNNSCDDNAITIGVASSKNQELLINIFAGLLKKFNINIEYNFYCNKTLKAGKISSINDIYSFKDYTQYDDICNDVTDSLLNKNLVAMLDKKDIAFNRLTVKKTNSSKNTTFGMEYIENKYVLSMGSDTLYYNLCLDRITSIEEAPQNKVIKIDGKHYLICGINWSKTPDFKIEGILQDMDQQLIIKNMFNILDLKKAC